MKTKNQEQTMDISIMIDMAEKPRRSVVDDQGGDNRDQSVCKKRILIGTI